MHWHDLLLHTLTGLHVILAGIVVIDLLHQHRSHGATVAWIAILLLLPYLGLALYFLAGAPRKHGRRLTTQLAMHRAQPPLAIEHSPLPALLRALHLPGPTRGNRLEVLTENEAAAEALLAVIDEARQQLYVSVFSFEHDSAGNRVIERIAAQARAGVDVRVLVDGFGSKELPRDWYARLRSAGVHLARFRPLPLATVRRGAVNYRNHRKMAVADARRAWIGGRNIANKYLQTADDGSSWADLSLIIDGPAVQSLAAVCRSDWLEARGSALPDPPELAPANIAADSLVQVVPSGPDLEDDVLHAALMTGISAAQRRVWIVSPFFVPDDPLLAILCLACRRGLDVRIVVPQRSNQRVADWVRASYLRAVQDAGGKVFRYCRSMLHTKAIVLDDSAAIVGSANFDMRSLFTNHEINLMLYSADDVRQIAACIDGYCRVAETGMARVGFATQVTGGALRLLAPLI